MKNSLMIFLLGMMFSASSHAIHTSWFLQCRSDKLKLIYDHNFPIGGDYKMALHDAELPSTDYEAKSYVSSAQATDAGMSAEQLYKDLNLLNTPEVIYLVTKTVVDSKVGPKKPKECLMDTIVTQSRMTIQIDTISDAASKRLGGLQAGEKVEFLCTTTLIEPNDNQCN